MKKTLLMTWLVLGLSIAAIAEETTSSDRLIPGSGADDTTYVTIGPGLAIHAGNLGWGINGGVLRQLGDFANVFYGLDFGFSFWNLAEPSIATGAYKSGMTGIHFLPTLIYRFELDSDAVVHPYFGAAVGPNLYLERTTTVTANARDTDSSASILLEALLRPGFFVPLFANSASLHVEAALGMLRSEFLFRPQASVVLAL